jgi:hypothetical protein
MRNLFVSLIITLASCGPKPSDHGLSEEAFGEWSSGHGQTVFVRRDGTYKFCEGKFCEEGKHIPHGKNMGVWLVNFGDMKATAKLRKISGWDESITVSVISKEPPYSKMHSMGQSGMPQSMRDELCGGRPCNMIGNEDEIYYTFSKMKDY